MTTPAPSIESLFLANYARLCYFASQQIRSKESAEDIVQEIFLNCWKKNMEFKNELQAKAYLYNSTRNACINFSRHRQVIQRFAETQQESRTEEARALDNIIRAEVLGSVHSAIETLPEGCRTVLKLAFFESLKNEEIADRLGISINTVKTQKARALQLLRLKLDNQAWLLVLWLISR